MSGQVSSEEATITWSEEAIHGLGVRTDVPTAGSILGLSRTQAYEAVKAGRFPVPVIPVRSPPDRPGRAYPSASRYRGAGQGRAD